MFRHRPLLRTLVMAAVVVMATLALAAFPTAAQSAPEDVVKALIAAEGSNNVDAATALFADDAVVTLADGSSYNTPDGIRGWQQELADGHFHLEVVNLQADGNSVTGTGNISLDVFRDLGIASLGGNWKIDIEAGKVKTFDFSWTPDAITELVAAGTAATLIAAESMHDVDGAVALFADDAVVTLADGSVYNTPDGIRQWQQALADGNFTIEPVGRYVDGSTVNWRGEISLDVFRDLGIPSLGGIWSLVIADGKVKTFDFSWTPAAAQMLGAPPSP